MTKITLKTFIRDGINDQFKFILKLRKIYFEFAIEYNLHTLFGFTAGENAKSN